MVTHYIEGTDGNYIPDPGEEVLVSDWFAETRDAAGELGTTEADSDDGYCYNPECMGESVWPPLAAPNHTAYGFVLVAFALGLMVGAGVMFLIAVAAGAI